MGRFSGALQDIASQVSTIGFEGSQVLNCHGSGHPTTDCSHFCCVCLFLKIGLSYLYRCFACAYVCALWIGLVFARLGYGFGAPRTGVMSVCESLFGV